MVPTLRATVLIVGAEHTLGELVRDVLAARGIHVLMACDGYEALTISLGVMIDAIVLEIDLAPLSPTEVLAALQLRQSKAIAAWCVRSKAEGHDGDDAVQRPRRVHPLEVCHVLQCEFNGQREIAVPRMPRFSLSR